MSCHFEEFLAEVYSIAAPIQKIIKPSGITTPQPSELEINHDKAHPH